MSKTPPAVVPSEAVPTGVLLEPGGPDPEKRALVRRLRRVQGQVRAIAEMVEAGRDCGDVVTQVAAASHALDRVRFLLVSSELPTCTTGGPVDGETPDAGAQRAAAEKSFLTLA